MSERPLVYLLVLNYKGFDDTVECVDNLLQQGYDNFKIVVLDNDSQDSSFEKLAEKYPDLLVVQTGANLGYAGGNNVGIRLAQQAGAKYVGVLNNDITADPFMVNKIVEAMEQDEKLAMTGPVILEWDRDIVQSAGARISLYTGDSIFYHQGEIFDELKQKDTAQYKLNDLGGAALFVRTEVLEKIGLIPEDYFLFYEETEWCLKAKKAGFKLACVPTTFIHHKESSSIGKVDGLRAEYMTKNQKLFVKRNGNATEKMVFGCLNMAKKIYHRISV